MKTLSILASIICLAATITMLQAQTPAPVTPVPVNNGLVTVPASMLNQLSAINPDALQNNINKWLMLGTAIVSGIAALAGFATAKAGEVIRSVQAVKDEFGGRMDRQAQRNDSLQAQVTHVALSTPPAVAPLALMSPAPAAPAAQLSTRDALSPAAGMILAFAMLSALLGLAGCQGNGGFTISPATKATASAVGKASLTAVENLAAGAAARGAANATNVLLQDGTSTNVADLEAAGSEGLFTQVFSVQSAKDVAGIFNAFTANKAPAVAAQLASAYTAAAPVTQADKVAVVNALATGVMTGASK